MIRAWAEPAPPSRSRYRSATRVAVDRKARRFLLEQQQPRTAYRSSILTPDDLTIDRHDSGAWSGTWTAPPASVAAPYTPILLQGPLWFPLVAGQPADFTGAVDVPFCSMDGWAGRRDLVNPSPPPDFVVDPATVYADGGTNWGRYYVVGSVDGVTQFVTPIGANATWTASVGSVAAGSWSFQIVTYADAADALADANRIAVGAPWLEADRPGDIRNFYTLGYTPSAAQFTGVSLAHPGDYRISGTLAAFTAVPGRTYQILVTNETDVEYCWALEPMAAGGAFTITRPQPFGGKIKLRLVEQVNGCSVRVVGQVWAEENAADAGAHADLRIEYRTITGAFPDSVQPAQLDNRWTVTLAGGGAVGRVLLVNVNTKRIYGEWTMPTGLMRSFNVPAEAAGQTTSEVYYDGFNDTCFLYDQAVALIALLQLGERDAAAKLVDALQGLQNPDGSFGFARNQATLAPDTSLIRNGAEAWVTYALLLADLPAFAGWFATPPEAAAKAGLARIMTYTNDLGLIDGGVGVPWWSCEHNIDIWWCLDQAHQNYGSGLVDYAGAAADLKAAMLTPGVGWDGGKGIFWQGGIVTGGVNTPDGMHALDTHTWGANLLVKWGLPSDAAVSIARAFDLYYTTDAASGRSGFTTFIPADGYPVETVVTPWMEGSFGAVTALRYVDPSRAQALMRMLMRSQRADGSYPYALQEDPANGIHSWPCVIAPAWNILAASGPGTPNERLFWRAA